MIASRRTRVVWIVAVALLLGLAVLNEFVMTGLGVPSTRPQLGDILVAVLATFVMAYVLWLVEPRSAAVREHSERTRVALVLLAVSGGVAMGLLILAQMVVLAEIDVGMRERYARLIAGSFLDPLQRTFSAAVMEEVLFRYFGMTALALFVARTFSTPNIAYRVALLGSAVVFGLAHLPAFSLAGAVIVFFSTLAGVLYGWMFWHWGLIYPILGHFAAGSARGIIIQYFGARWFL